MKRRSFLYGTAIVLAMPCTVLAQRPEKVPRVGFLAPGPPACNEGREVLNGFFHGLGEFGFVPERNIIFDKQCYQTESQIEYLVTDMLGRLPAIIVVTGTRAALAAKRATRTIPVVFAAVADPLKVGLVETLARPGGNVTGVSNMRLELGTKHLQVLKELVPSMTHVSVLLDPTPEITAFIWREMQQAARALGVILVRLEARSGDEIDVMFRNRTKGTSGLVVVPSGTFWVQRTRIAQLAIEARLPSIFPWANDRDSGALIAYGVSDVDTFRVAGRYVGMILKGAKPAELPVEQPTKFYFVINLKTAKLLSLTVPPSLVLRADEVIE
jgi:putative ABC transport system substrate-binding protein